MSAELARNKTNGGGSESCHSEYFYFANSLSSLRIIWIRNEVSAELARKRANGGGIESCHSDKIMRP